MIYLATRFVVVGFSIAAAIFAGSAFVVWGWPDIANWNGAERLFVLLFWAVLTAVLGSS